MQTDTEKQRLHRRVIRNKRRLRFVELTKTGVPGIDASRTIEREFPFDGPATASARQIAPVAKAASAPAPAPAPAPARAQVPTPAPSQWPSGAVAVKPSTRPTLQTEWVSGQCRLTPESACRARSHATKAFESSQQKQADERAIEMRLHGDSYIASESLALYRLGAGSPAECWTIACQNEREVLDNMEPGALRTWREQRLAQTMKHLGLAGSATPPAPAASKPTPQPHGRARVAAAWNEKYSK